MGLGELAAATVGVAGEDAVAVADVGPVLGAVHRLELFDDYDGPLKRRERHDVDLGACARSAGGGCSQS